jgi:hypothetical protein
MHDDEDQEDMYRAQFLEAFNLTEWDDNKINAETEKLYSICKTKKEFPMLLNKLKQSEELKLLLSIIGDSDDVVFKCMFRFELFDVAHRYFCSILGDEQENESAINNIINKIK